MEILVKTSLTLALLLTAGANSLAQSTITAASRDSQETHDAARGGPLKPVACRDTTPHTKRFVTVDKGVDLQVLDWGGADKPDAMVLLTGYGENAHVYDEFAYQFTDYFHVIGITRRGFLPSSQPESGYDVRLVVKDVLIGDDTITIRHSIPVSQSPQQGSCLPPNQPGGSNYLLCKGSDH